MAAEGAGLEGRVPQGVVVFERDAASVGERETLCLAALQCGEDAVFDFVDFAVAVLHALSHIEEAVHVAGRGLIGDGHLGKFGSGHTSWG